jgi:hypothetical protein
MHFWKKLFGTSSAPAVSPTRQTPSPISTTQASSESAIVSSTASRIERGKDFLDVYPSLCVLCTTRSQSDILPETEEWVTTNHVVAIATLLGMSEPDEARALIARFKASNDFGVHVLSEFSKSSLLSERAEELASVMLGKGNRDKYRSFSSAMNDIYKKTDLIRFCWFFKK